MYDKHNKKRRAIAIVQVASESVSPGQDEMFARAFDQVADQIYRDTCAKNACTKVGFFIDPISPDPTSNFGTGINDAYSTYGARFKPTPETTGPLLAQQSSILGIHAYSPEGWIDRHSAPISQDYKVAWKADFSRRWRVSGVPFLQDVTPGYDGTKLFTGQPGLHRWGYDDAWRSALLDMTKRYGSRGLVYNSWNGYCEGLAGMETDAQGTTNATFINALMATYH